MRIHLQTLCFCAAISISLCGCETDPATSPVTITPSSTTIRQGQSVVFTASGGYDYQWSLSDHSLGTISAGTGPQTTYTSIQNPAAASVQILTVSSTINGSATGSNSNAAPYTATAEAHITHTASSGATTASALAISPTSANLAVTPGAVTFTATGGSGSYSWSLSSSTLGAISATTGSSITYTKVTGSGTNTLTVTSGSAHVSATITQ